MTRGTRALAAVSLALALAGTSASARADEALRVDGAGPGVASLALPIAVQRGRIMVRAERGMERLARREAGRARDALDQIAEDLPDLPVPRRLEIRLVQRAADLARAAPPGRGAPRWAIGVAYPDLGVVVAAYRRGPIPSDLDQVVTHELAHLALGAALGPRAPRWLHEGFAYLHSSDFSLDRTRTLTGMAWTGRVIPLEELDQSFPDAELEAARAYAESYDLVVYLARRGHSAGTDDDGNPWAFRQFLAALAHGASLDEAARQAYAATMADLFDEWRASLKQRYMVLPVGLFGLFIWVVAAALLIFGWLRTRRRNRATLRRWEAEEAGLGLAVFDADSVDEDPDDQDMVAPADDDRGPWLH